MDRSCGDGKTDGVHQLQPLFLLLFRRFNVFARTARAAVAAETTPVAIATEAAFAVTAETAAAIVAFAVTIGLAHHRRGTFLMLFDANGEVADDVFADPLLPLDLRDRSRGRIDVDQHEVR